LFKARRARRTVETPTYLASLFVDLRKNDASTMFVCQDEIGRPLDPDQLHAVLHAAQDVARVNHFGFHGLRHLDCSLLVNSGAPVKDAPARLGHASATTTLDS
jgi:integrase